MGIFKNKKTEEKNVEAIEIENQAEGAAEEVQVKEQGLFKKIKKRVWFKITIKNPEKEKEPKPKKEKKPKKDPDHTAEKSAEKPEPKKEIKEAAADEATKGKKKSKKRLFIIIGAAVLLVSAGATATLLMINRGQAVSDRLLEASMLVASEEYEEALEIYESLLKKDKTLIEAYLGQAECLVNMGDAETALSNLEEALEPTDHNELISDRIEQLRTPEPEPEDGQEPEPQNTEITFEDASFEKMIRIALQKTDGSPIYDTDTARITYLSILGETHTSISGSLHQSNSTAGYTIKENDDEVLYDERGGIRTLNDLQYFPNLKHLTVGYNSVTDLSGISGLKSLVRVSLYFNEISDISVLSGLSELTEIYVYGNSISDISAIAGLHKLERLWVNYNDISDISAVRGLTGLVELSISHNNITDISPVAGLTSLLYLIANDNGISDISVLQFLPELIEVSFIDNPVQDYSPVSHVRNVNRT